MQQLLNYQADRVEMVLWHNGIQGRVVAVDVLPRVTAFHLVVGNDDGDILVKIRRLSNTLALRLDAIGEVRIRRDGGKVVLEVPHGRLRPVPLLHLQQEVRTSAGEKLPSQTMILGIDTEGRPLLLRLPSPDVAHALVAGTTGSGKSSLMVTMILSLAMSNRPSQAQMVLIDPKGRTFASLAGLPHLLTGMVMGEDVAIRALTVMERLVTEMQKRDRVRTSMPRIYVFIDELVDLMSANEKAFQAVLARLTQRGREAGIHLIAGTQKPLAAELGSLAKANFPTRIVGSVASPEDAKVATGVGGTGAEKLAGKGDFLLVAKGRTTRFQAAYVPPRAIPGVVAQLRARSPSGRRWEITTPDESTEAVADRIRKLIPFPGQRGGHNREDPPEAIEDARAGMSAWALRRKYGRGGSWADRMVAEYGPASVRPAYE